MAKGSGFHNAPVTSKLLARLLRQQGYASEARPGLERYKHPRRRATIALRPTSDSTPKSTLRLVAVECGFPSVAAVIDAARRA